jgi:hypothetical protein
MLHLKSPVIALERIRSVCADDGRFMSVEQIDPLWTLVARRRPAMAFRAGENAQWLVPNPSAHRALVESAGFRVQRSVRPFAEPFGAAGDTRGIPASHRLLTRIVTGAAGVPHAALLAGAA